jgi:hypothetical protein
LALLVQLGAIPGAPGACLSGASGSAVAMPRCYRIARRFAREPPVEKKKAAACAAALDEAIGF